MKEIILSNGTKMPYIGFGTWKAPDDEVTTQAVLTAIEAGCYHIDCAAIYKNEKAVGKALSQTTVKREDLFITSKLWNDTRGYQETIDAFNKSLNDLGLDYLDLYLIHWPRPIKYRDNYIEMNSESWKAMEYLYKIGKVKAIGVSNFLPKHLDALMENCEIKPMVNQIEFHPGYTQNEVVEYCKEKGILVEGYSTLANGDVFKCQELIDLGIKLNVSVAHICTQYSIQKGIVPLIKSVNKKRIINNLNIDFTLSTETMAYIDRITTCPQVGADPDHTNF